MSYLYFLMIVLLCFCLGFCVAVIYIFWAVNISINNNLILSCTSLHIYQLFHSFGRRDSRFEPDLVTDWSNKTCYWVKLGPFIQFYIIIILFLLLPVPCARDRAVRASRSLGWASPPMLCEPTFIKSVQHVSHSASHFISIKLFIITRHSSQGGKNSFRHQETNKL